MQLKIELRKNIKNNKIKTFDFIFLLNESLKLSFDDMEDSSVWFEVEVCSGSNKTSLLCNGGGRVSWKCWGFLIGNRLTLDFKCTGRGGIGGGTFDILSDEKSSLFIERAMASVCKFWRFEFESNFC